GERKLQINISLIEDYMLIAVEDNGIGREAASKLGKKKNGKAIGMLQERVAILKEQHKVDYSIEIEDKMVEDVATGTKVCIKLPVD
ncbi:MAG: hypothetical protein MI922_28875, partial [Bacteroidales bacterium]|nr:hypothetical protein [Bacteroidales bacterium]